MTVEIRETADGWFAIVVDGHEVSRWQDRHTAEQIVNLWPRVL